MSSPADWPNLKNLIAFENDVFKRQLDVASSDDHMRAVLKVINDSLDFMIEFASGEMPTEDDRTISALAGRIFNTSAAALREALCGYHQTSFMLQRDLIEIHVLQSRFAVDLPRIDEWRKVTNKDRQRIFSHGKNREFLKQHDAPHVRDRRESEYRLFSEHAAHPTFSALRMLNLPNGKTQLGPREDPERLRHTLHELGRRVAAAALSNSRVLICLMRRDDRVASEKVLTMRSELAKVIEEVFAQPPTPAPSPNPPKAEDQAVVATPIDSSRD